METIRKAAESDIPALSAIWKTCFGDSDAYVAAFFAGWFGRERCLLLLEDNVPAAMVHLLPVRVVKDGHSLPGQYLYAAATLPQFRGRGLMRRLLGAARENGERAGCAFTVLVPAEPGLFDYYEKSGFRAFAPYAESMLPQDALSEMARDIRPAPLRPLSAGEAATMRARRFPAAVLWEPSDFQQVLLEFTGTGGRFYGFEDGYAVVRVTQEEAVVRELCCSPAKRPAMLLTVARAAGMRRLRLQAPCEMNGGQARPMRHAMYLPHGEALSWLADAFDSGALYMNLMMD